MTAATAEPPTPEGSGALAVFRNRPFLLLWLAQAATQIGGNMVLFGLTVIVVSVTRSNSAVSVLILTFLVPAVLFSALAGVYVDRLDRRFVLVATNLLRGIAFVAIFLAGDFVPLILLLNIVVSSLTVFFAPAELSMIPILVPKRQLLAANGIFTLTLNAAFALGFALLGPFVVKIAGPEALILLVAVLYFVAAAFCATLPPAPATTAGGVNPFQAVADAERAVETTLAQLGEGLAFIRANPGISWSLVYLGIAASLVGVLGVLGPDFAETTLGLAPEDFVVVVLPLGLGLVTGILVLNSYGRYLPRRRVIEVGLVALGALLAVLSIAGPVSRFLQRAEESSVLVDLSALTSLLSVVVAIAFVTGMAYAVVAIPSQTQLQEDLPEDVRGRVFGVLNMLVSVSSFLPIIIVGPISDLVGTTTVLLVVAAIIAASGIASILRRGPLLPAEYASHPDGTVPGLPVDPLGVTHVQPARTFELPDDAEASAPAEVEATGEGYDAAIERADTVVVPVVEPPPAGERRRGRGRPPDGAGPTLWSDPAADDDPGAGDGGRRQ